MSLPVFQKFCQTQWPAPEEYSQLEAQTSLGRTDIVRWFKDHRSALKSGESLDWMESFKSKDLGEQQRGGQEQNGRAADKQQCVSSEVKAGKREFWTHGVESKPKSFEKRFLINCTAVISVEQASGNAPTTREHSKASEQDKVQWLNERLAHSVMDLSRAKAEQNSPAADKGRWVQRQETELESSIYIAVSDLCYRNVGGGEKKIRWPQQYPRSYFKSYFWSKNTAAYGAQ